MRNLTPLILLLPLAGFVVLGLFGRALPRTVISLIGCGVIGAAFIVAAANFVGMLGVSPSSRVADASFWTWVNSGKLTITFGLLFDPLTAVMLLVITGVGFLIHVYSIGYMEGDPGYWRYFAFLNLFVFAMSLLVTADTFLFLLVGWAGVGLASFLLIGFWYTRPSAVAAARKAFVVNTIGDFGLLLAIFLIFINFGTLAYTRVLGLGAPSLGAAVAGIGPATLNAIALLLFVAAAAKSAQLPLHVWLPDAMEGPTPVSALIHAATMVTAGVYLVARAWPIFTAAPDALGVVAVVAGATMLFAATIACVQHDIKRILAYSTMSQLGYMFLGEAAGSFTTGIFHLTTHAYFKALLFMGAGAVIHALAGEQDIRKMGGLRARLPRTFVMFAVGALALAAIVPFAGFWSKDSILGAVLVRASTSGAVGWYILYGVGLLTSVLTGYYIFRLIFLVFFGSYRGGEIVAHGGRDPHPAPAGRVSRDPLARVHEVGATMLVPMAALAVLSTLSGFYGTPWNEAISDFLAPAVRNINEGLRPENGLFWLAFVIGLVTGPIGIAMAWARFGRGEPRFADQRNALVRLLDNRYYVDALYDAVFVRPVRFVGVALRGVFEGVFLDGGSRGLGDVIGQTGRGLRRLQTGYARNYALAILTGAVLILLYYLVRP